MDVFALPISLPPSTGCRPVVLGSASVHMVPIVLGVVLDIARGIAVLSSPSYRVLPALLSRSSWVAPASSWVSPLHPGYWLFPSSHRRLVPSYAAMVFRCILMKQDDDELERVRERIEGGVHCLDL
jgi:hypothetical protein